MALPTLKKFEIGQEFIVSRETLNGPRVVSVRITDRRKGRFNPVLTICETDLRSKRFTEYTARPYAIQRPSVEALTIAGINTVLYASNKNISEL